MNQFKSLLAIRNNIKFAIQKDYNISHMITYMHNSKEEFVVDVFTDGLVTVLDPKTKELISHPKVTSTIRTIVPYANLTRFMNIVFALIARYDIPAAQIRH